VCGNMETVPIQANGLASEDAGVRQQHSGFKPPTTPAPGMLTAEMAQAAAVKYKKDQKKIQKACAALEPPPPSSSGKKCCGLSCTIM
jgi:hypothetical protein